MFFKRKKNTTLNNPGGSKSGVSEKLNPGTNYFVEGEDVVFDLNGLDFTFEGFYVQPTHEGMFIHVREEVPMNLMNISAATPLEEGMDPKVLSRDIPVHFTLELKPEVLSGLRDDLFQCGDIKEIFDIEREGSKPLRIFSN